MPSRRTRCAWSWSKTTCSVDSVDFAAALERVVAVHQHLGLDDRHQARFLAERGVARQCVRVGFDAAGLGIEGRS
jgi:hypothetical protein